ncbi:LOW QUALITY PROTEIN: outer surface protein [Bacillus sp. JCM 19046]|nr:LOW QUALITY PROTEIN: outer surface protein [Bacillus sp. JCM 19046]
MKKLGVSVYLNQSVEEQRDYLQTVYENGFTLLFTSLHIPEEDASLYAGRLKEVARFAKQQQMELICDVAPQSLKYLMIDEDEIIELLNWGVTGLRIDYGFSPEVVATISTKMTVILNASTLHEEDIQTLLEAGVNQNQLEVGHNFYPRPETGLGRATFQQANKLFREKDFQVMAFVPGDNPRGPLFKQLPTLEDHRDWSPFAAFIDLFKGESVDTVFIGDIGLSAESLEQFRLYAEEDVIVLRAKAMNPNEEIPEIHWNRNDVARDVLRSAKSRSLNLTRSGDVIPLHTVARPIGTITMDNNRYGRYQGEIQVTKTDLPADEKVNVIGHVVEDDLALLPYIEGGQKWMFKWV